MSRRRWLRPVPAAILLLAVLATIAPAALGAEPPGRIPGQAVYDLAGILDQSTTRTVEQLAAAIDSAADADLVVVTERPEPPVSGSTAITRADEMFEALGIGVDRPRGGLLVYLFADPDNCQFHPLLLADDRFTTNVLPEDASAALVDETMTERLVACDPNTALLAGMGRLLTTAFESGSESGPPNGVAAGPPFPPPVDDVAVYDHAGVFDPETIASAEATIDGIENRTGAEVVVYTQVVGSGGSEEQSEANAIALMDQWGVGRLGFDDGLVILFDLDDTLVHGQVRLYAGPGYREAFLSNWERQQIFENDMLPRLQEEDLDGALLAALEKIDANATPEHAAVLLRARQIDAAIGLLGAPLLFLGLTAWAVSSWWRLGRDPVYLDDPSIHIPAPPPELTAAAATLVLEGRASRRALTTALLDLASRGRLTFREEKELLGLRKKVGIETQPAPGDPVTEANRARNDRRPISAAERYALEKLRSLAEEGYIEPAELLKFGTSVGTFEEMLEAHVVDRGWFQEQPRKVTGRWGRYGAVALVLGIVAGFGGLQLGSFGLVFLGVAAGLGGAVLLVLARSMPAVTMPGAMIRAMLAAYRRTLEKTMAQARSMQQVVDEAKLDWLETPDQAVVWGLALGLQGDVERVLERTVDDARDGATTGGYLPAWYSGGGGSGGEGLATAGGGGLFSSGSLPNFGGMMGALGSIGNSPSSSGSGGGFGGGGSGGGGGGAGGGF